MARTTFSIAITVIAASVALAGCSGTTAAEPEESAPPAASETQAPAETTTPETTDAAEPSATTELLAVVGSDENPEAFEIVLTDADGAPVTTLPAGDYSVTFVDRSSMHNFRMTGPGDVDVSTDVPGSDESTIEITLVEGTYEYVCEPHASSMNGSVEVTG